MECRMLPIGKLIDYSAGGGWGKEEKGGDYLTEVAIIRGVDFPSIEQGRTTPLVSRWEKDGKASKAALRSGDIVIEISGGTDQRPTGRTIFVLPEMLEPYSCPVIPASFCRVIRPNTSIVFPAYLYYWLQDMYNKGRTWGYQNRSTGLSNFQFKVFLESEVVRFPELNQQKAIAASLLAFDKKISINNQLNDYLAA